ncbi:Vacuolar protein sorting-associated protein 17 [Fulvia fulva]|uniref:Vacuolar protein sorting-associated protein 17 n=1 Tax=Passalora fulva TaxID=5499 RepID=A0A9Q8LHJ2_PASFU|nr:Vacuolar protein sorting-associated protein 17 [Fulvia fulva]KAK4624120.1 Vacuolar protein sorting-associated protein 17 [Fulvia fulva]KAK4624812.1 Vacuolar protein sorting-associated protein 17 [Fulvia fulva]UJO17557.1 Vacuolar protein sorting-associated protein 17 [Fulvia fulva]WPV15429.1 Vacuolar protein sorting-associated protein 17 [Fulvia fulva]WPV29617.1 Vacuolar protein sorting-associated protein 17 [Fulvia fulva]
MHVRNDARMSSSDQPQASSSGSSGKQPADRIQPNLRFQRRISERHYTEDSYRERTPVMEYPSGTSPWASSPEASRAGSSNDIPHEDLPGPAFAAGAIPESDDAASSAAHANGAHEHEGGWTPEQQHQWQQQQHQSQQHQQHQYQQHHQQGSQEENRRPAQSRYHNVPQQQRQHQPQYKLQAKITGLERAGKKDSILKFDVYVRNRFYVVRQAEQTKLTVHQTNLPKFRTTQFRDIRRTHSEFQKFASHLIGANPEALVPAVPPASTSAGLGTEEDDNRTKANMQRWLSVVCSNDVLMRDEEMVFFVESDFGYSPVARKKQPATGVRRKYLKQFQPPPDDTPELLESRPIVKSFYLGSMDAQQKVDKVVKHRRSLGVAESDLGIKIQALANNEMHTGLGNAYKKLGKVVQNTGDYHAAQGTAEATTLADPLAYHSSDAFIVKESLTNRHILLRELIQAQQTTRSKLTAADRLKASSSVKRDKVDEAISALDEARSHEAYLQQKTQRVTQNLLLEKRKWFMRTAAELRTGIREYVIREIEAERRTLATLEQVRPDVRAIDASGGLSRLGREAHPAARRTSMASSQGPKGDAWSGVPRRPDGLNRSISGSWPAVPEEGERSAETGDATGRRRATSGASSLGQLSEDDDDDRIDARNAASRLAQTTF